MASFWLEFEHGGQTQQVNFESDSIAIGRDRSSDFVLDHPTVSRQHALIVHQGQGRFQLVVLSRGGLTALDGQPVQSSEIDLFDGAQLTFGQYTVRFRSHQAPSRPSSGGGGAGNNQFGSSATGASGPQGNQFGSGPQGNQFGSGPQGNQFGSGPGSNASEPATPEAKPDNPMADAAGIMSWDEIAATSEEEDEDSLDDAQATDFQRIQSAKKEESNPLIIFGALGLAVVMLIFAITSGGGGGGEEQVQQDGYESWPVVEIDVRCHDEATCRREAERQYDLGLDRIENHAVETENLFEGYVHLLNAKEFLDQGGIESIPEEMSEWQEKHDRARSSLDQTFRDQRMRVHRAGQRGRYEEVVEVLDEIQIHFPDRSARENRWAREYERRMRAEGTYPRSRNR